MPRTLDFVLADVLTDDPFGGNPLTGAVLPAAGVPFLFIPLLNRKRSRAHPARWR